MVSDLDLSYGIAIAAVVLLIAAFVWPGVARAQPDDFAGYWADTEGGLYEFRRVEGRAFTLRGGPEGVETAVMAGLRRVAAGARSGRLELGGRALAWSDGKRWYRQGAAPTPGPE